MPVPTGDDPEPFPDPDASRPSPGFQSIAGFQSMTGPRPAPVPELAAPKRGRAVTVGLAVLAMVCLIAAVGVGRRADTELTRKPTSAELSAAAAAGVADRWQRWTAGQIFPAGLGYTSDLLTRETARRIGIAAGHACAPALDSAVAIVARIYGCRAALRATYLAQLGGVSYTLGVLAFPDTQAAVGFYASYQAGRFPVSGLHALALPGTPADAFTDAARQAATSIDFGPYVVLTVAGYADGRPAAATDERRPSVFAPATQLASAVGEPLNGPVTVNCAARSAAREWSC